MKPRVLILASATLFGVVALGLLMQRQALSGVYRVPDGANAIASAALSDIPEDPDVPLVLENIALTVSVPNLQHDDSVLQQNPGCDLKVSAEPRAGAMVALSAASCTPNEIVTIHHNGMIFKTALDDQGVLDRVVPALNAHSVFIIETASGLTAKASAEVPEILGFNRIVLQWAGHGGFELHAREFGADYGEVGHVWSGTAHNGIGSVMRLGDMSIFSPLVAEVYSYPADNSPKDGTIELTVESEVTSANCDHTISAQTLDLRSGLLRSRDLVLNMPNCEATGDFLVLNNLVENLTIAAN